MNFKELALAISKLEGGKKEINITQIREILKCLRLLLRKDPLGVLKVLVK